MSDRSNERLRRRALAGAVLSVKVLERGLSEIVTAAVGPSGVIYTPPEVPMPLWTPDVLEPFSFEVAEEVCDG